MLMIIILTTYFNTVKHRTEIHIMYVCVSSDAKSKHEFFFRYPVFIKVTGSTPAFVIGIFH